MATTLLQQVEDYVGTQSDTAAVGDWLTRGAKYLVDISPVDKLRQYTKPVAFTSSTGISDIGMRIIDVSIGGRRSNPITYSQKAQAADANSIYLATALAPVHYLYNQKIYGLPVALASEAIAITYPAYDGSETTVEVTEIPSEFIQGVILYTSIQARIRQITDLANTTMSAITIAGMTAPATPSALSVSYTNTETALTAEDIELAQAHLSEVQVKISEYGAVLGKYQADIGSYSAQVQEEMARVAALINQYNSQFTQYKTGLDSLRAEFIEFLQTTFGMGQAK